MSSLIGHLEKEESGLLLNSSYIHSEAQSICCPLTYLHAGRDHFQVQMGGFRDLGSAPIIWSYSQRCLLQPSGPVVLWCKGSRCRRAAKTMEQSHARLRLTPRPLQLLLIWPTSETMALKTRATPHCSDSMTTVTGHWPTTARLAES